VLVDLLIQLQLHFDLLPETLFLTVNCVDRFLSHKAIPLKKLELVGATALSIASKYEEAKHLSAQDIMCMLDRDYTISEIAKVERNMLRCLGLSSEGQDQWSFLDELARPTTITSPHA